MGSSPILLYRSLNSSFIMGQQEVYDYLLQEFMKDKKQWFTSKEISDSLDISIGSITACLKKLRKTETIEYETTGNRNEYRYRFKVDKETPQLKTM